MVWVQVNDVVLVGQGAPLSLLDEPTDLINLTELEDVPVALVEGVSVEPGLYTQVRFVLGGAVLLDDDGGVYGYGDVEAPAGLEITGDLTCPSCSQSGIKVRLPGGVVLAEGDDAGVLMDFDIAQSFGHQAGQSGRWVMHPVILGTVDDAGAIMGGEAEAKITGTVSLGADVVIPMCGGGERGLEDFVPVATSTVLVDDDGNALVFMGETDEDGFKIEVLGVDTYDLGYEAETDFGAQKLVWEAEVEPDQAVVEANGDEVDGVAYTVTAVSCEPPPAPPQPPPPPPPPQVDDDPDEFEGIATLVSVEGDAPARTVRVELTNDNGSVAVDIVEGSTLFDSEGDILGFDDLLAALDLVDLVIEIEVEGERQEDGSVIAATINVEIEGDVDDDPADDDPDEFEGIATLVSVEGDLPARTVRVELTNDNGSVAVDIVEGSTLFDSEGDVLGFDDLLAALDPVDLVIEIEVEGERQEDGSVIAATIKVEIDDDVDDDPPDDDPDEFEGIATLVSVEGDLPARTVRVELTNDHGSVAVDIVEGSTLFDSEGDILGFDDLLAALDPVDLVIEIEVEGERQEDGSVIAAEVEVETHSVS